MGFLLSLDIGRFDMSRQTGYIDERPLTADEVDAAIVRAGGRLYGDGRGDPREDSLTAAMILHGKVDVRGYLGLTRVVHHPSGYARLSFDARSAGPVEAFVRWLCQGFGCEVFSWEFDEWKTPQILEWLAGLAGRGG